MDTGNRHQRKIKGHIEGVYVIGIQGVHIQKQHSESLHLVQLL